MNLGDGDEKQRGLSEPERQGGQPWCPQLILAKQGRGLSHGME